MNNPPHTQRIDLLEEWLRIIFLFLLFGLCVACLIADVTFTILIGLNMIVLPHGSAILLAGPSVCVFGLFRIALTWLSPKPSSRPPIHSAQVQNASLCENDGSTRRRGGAIFESELGST